MRINSLSFSFLVCVATLTGDISFGKPAKVLLRQGCWSRRTAFPDRPDGLGRPSYARDFAAAVIEKGGRNEERIREAKKLFGTIEAQDEESFLKANPGAKTSRSELPGARSYFTGDIQKKYEIHIFGNGKLLMCTVAERMSKREAVEFEKKLVARLGKPEFVHRDVAEKQGLLSSCSWAYDKDKLISCDVAPVMSEDTFTVQVGLRACARSRHAA